MLRPGQVIALCALALLTLGVVMVNSAGMRVHIVDPQAATADPGVTAQSILFSRSTIYAGLALTALFLGSIMPVRYVAARLRGPSGSTSHPLAGLPLFALGVVLLLMVCALVYVPGLSRVANNSPRWISIPGLGGAEGLSAQPSEIAKWGLIFFVAAYCVARRDLLPKFWLGLVPALVGIGAVAAFVAKADLGTGTLIALVACIMLLAAGARVWQFALFVPLGILGFVAAVQANQYRVARITSFLNPYADAEKTGYHMIQSLRAIAEGEGAGRGLGWSVQKFNYLPEDKTDFIFAIICEELGIGGAAIVVGLFLALLWSCHAIIRREREPLLRLLGLGVLTTVGLQAIINLAVVTGLAPTKGIALPLLSSGGTGWMMTGFSLGLVVAIERSQRGMNEVPLANDGSPTLLDARTRTRAA
jgi:cell division protein FtsW